MCVPKDDARSYPPVRPLLPVLSRALSGRSHEEVFQAENHLEVFSGNGDTENGTNVPGTGFSRSLWGIKRLNLGNLHLPALKTVQMQLLLLSCIFFLGPGMFCMLNRLGGGGLEDATASNQALVANNVCIALVGLVAGPLVTRIGYRISICLGAAGYILYTCSLLTYQITGNAPFLIFSGAMLGVLCTLLWTAQGSMLLSYPPPELQGKYISYVWTIFNLGAVFGSLV